MNSKSPQYFCDLPVADINAISCSASRFLYHGSTHGAFGKLDCQHGTIDLSSIDAFRVKLEHLSSDPLKKGYDYHLAYISHDLFEALWKGCKKSKIPGLKKFVSEIGLSHAASTVTSKIADFLHITDDKPMTFSRYCNGVPVDNYVPDSYRHAFKSKFQGILLRTKSECKLFVQLLQAHGLKVVDRREISDDYDGNLRVDCFAS